MLKITITETPTEQRWVLEGRLAQPWVDVLRRSGGRPAAAARGVPASSI